MEADPIRIAAAVIVDSRGRTLLVRKRGTQAFMQAGGKIGSGEAVEAALAREIREELGCEIIGEAHPLGRLTAPAANEPGRRVEADLFRVEIEGIVHPGAEIEECCWVDCDALSSTTLAPLTRDHVVPLLRARVGEARR